ncbi:MAG: SusD/RagB family nutrient-binding outer rane lipoprotein [Chitinophagaceae bacterium]|nr:SusD/RagB family nutrient-binding outer rane lipoprotein [Chitinophagaceae bacterium]
MKIIKFFFAIAATTMLATSCNKVKDFGDTNVNPNGTATPSTAALLTNVETGMGGFATQTQGGIYAQQFSETQYTDVSLYALPKLNFDGIYAGALMDLQNIININTADATKALSVKFGSNANQIAIARILKAYIFWTITDRWGDIPYFDALKGETNLTPKYDKQEDIYKDLIKELTEAKNQFDAGAAASGDIIYYKSTSTTAANAANWSAAVSRWKKLANSLRMLISLRTSKVYPNPGEWAATNFAAAFKDADGYIASNADNFVENYTGTVAGFKNPFFNLFESRHDYAESKLMTDLLGSTQLADPRQAAFGSTNVGFPYGLRRDDAVTFGSNNNYAEILAATKRAATSPVVIIGADDVLLAISEAAQRGWITADVVSFYKAGIQASWDQWVVAGDMNTYYANPSVALTGTAASNLTKIQLQQYIAFYPDGIQAWANWRRTGVPALTPTAFAVNSSKQIPRRYVYGANEYSVNATGVAEAVARQGADTENTRVWWDKP